ncbi:hypothetical protein HHK36_015494 [Tetracentron sinense]|uniref:Retroviral polymerase SH3-like domain-containing protein n=1 Tax=Tetracentron sinense TaxID=13715 RepID=A0A834Z535_TETSI|nr:hypothetical protein HHK36_015494 [Tetracentron sinense]
MKMGFALFLLVILLCSSTRGLCGGAVVAAAAPREIDGCNGTIAECLDQEFLMDSEVSRRLLSSSSYPQSQDPNSPLCPATGKPYRSCTPGGPGNKGTGCLKIYGCRQGRCPTKSVKNKTPQQAWGSYKPSVSHLKIFGCISYAQVPEAKRKKLDDHGEKCIFIGYSEESKAYKLYNPLTNKVVVSRDVIFSEEETWNWDKEEKIKENQIEIEEQEADYGEQNQENMRQTISTPAPCASLSIVRRSPDARLVTPEGTLRLALLGFTVGCGRLGLVLSYAELECGPIIAAKDGPDEWTRFVRLDIFEPHILGLIRVVVGREAVATAWSEEWAVASLWACSFVEGLYIILEDPTTVAGVVDHLLTGNGGVPSNCPHGRRPMTGGRVKRPHALFCVSSKRRPGV